MPLEIKQGLFKLDITDYHAILGVPLDADPREIRLRYLKIAPKLHPDTCKVNHPQAKEQAGNILARLVNPAYEHLSKEKSRAEHQLLLSQKAKTIAAEGRRLTLASDTAKSLAKAGSKLEEIYHKLINALAMDQYRDLDTIPDKIAQISEINLVYLVFKETQKSQVRRQQGIPDSGILPKPTEISPEGETTQIPPKEKSEKVSPVEACLKRAQEYRESHKYKEAILELRDILQIEPNNSNCHAMLGLIYIEQNSPGLAKIHIAKAWQTDPNNPIVKEAKEALDQQNKEGKTQVKEQKAKSGLFSNLFGKKK